MKLSHRLDLDALRAAAATKIDETFATRAAGLVRLAPIHAAKVVVARAVKAGDPVAAQLLAGEAAARGVTPLALAERILDRSSAQVAAILALDARRMDIKTRLALAPSGQAIAALEAEAST